MEPNLAVVVRNLVTGVLNVKRNPDNLKRREEVANNYYKLEMFSEALKEYDQILIKYPTSVNALNKKGILLIQQSDYANAVKNFDKILEISCVGEEVFRAIINKALAYSKMQKFDKSLKMYEEAYFSIKTCSKENHRKYFRKVHHNRATTYVEMGSYEAAKEDFSLALDFTDTDEKRVLTYNELGYLYLKAGWVLEEAQDYLHEARVLLDTMPMKQIESAYNDCYQALLYKKQGLFKKSFVFYKKALCVLKDTKIFEEVAKISYEISTLLEACGNFKEAAWYLAESNRYRNKITGRDENEENHCTTFAY